MPADHFASLILLAYELEYLSGIGQVFNPGEYQVIRIPGQLIQRQARLYTDPMGSFHLGTPEGNKFYIDVGPAQESGRCNSFDLLESGDQQQGNHSFLKVR